MKTSLGRGWGDERRRNERLGAGVPRDMFLKPQPFD